MNCPQEKNDSNLTKAQKGRLISIFCGIYFFIHIVIYSSHNFKEVLVKEVFNISLQNYSKLECISVIKLIGPIASAWLCQKSIRPLWISIIATCTFIGTLVVILNHLIPYRPINVLLGGVHMIADSAILPSIDAECLSILGHYNISKSFGKVRMFSTIGHTLAYLINYITQVCVFKTDTIRISVLLNTTVFGIISILCILIGIMTLKKKKMEKKEAFRFKESFSWSIFTLPIVIILLCALGSGFSRSSLQSYLTDYLKSTRTRKNEQHLIYFTRTICELGVWSLVILLDDYIPLEILYPIGILLGSIRALLYTFKFSSSLIILVLPYIAETFKSAYSAMFIYASIRLSHRYSPPEQKALAQGIFTGVYSGLSPFIASITAMIIFSDTTHSDIYNKEVLFRLGGYIGILSSILALSLYFCRHKYQIQIQKE
ncbi:hypothetical protein NEOKW01_1758 [Nematocida sp. AWRm80]|nr:hypothetical protein NEOKW01_1758 [Nematocida sp. AWRm80]